MAGRPLRVENHVEVAAHHPDGVADPGAGDRRQCGDHPERLDAAGVSPNYFSLLGARPQLGRLFDPGDTAPGLAEAVVITDGLWHREFGGERSVLGHQMRLDTDLYTIVGVLPPDF